MFALDGIKRKHSQDLVYRSNSSLDLVPGEHFAQSPLRREYGSHGSIDVLGGSQIGRNHGMTGGFDKPKTDNIEHVDGPVGKLISSSSPKLRIKFHKFWGGNGTGSSIKQQKRQIPLDDTVISMNSLTESYSNVSIDCPDGEDHNKRKHFAHHDCQSLVANLSYAAKLRGILLGRRRNTTTGASAASLLQSRSETANFTNRSNSNELSKLSNDDGGDGGCQHNDLVDSCPFFTNEIGGEEERSVSLSWKTARFKRNDQKKCTPGGSSWHRPCPAYGLSILEFPPGQSHWKLQCPFSVNSTQSLLPVENQDLGALFYRKYFYGQDHQNWFGMDEHLGPVAISIKKERVELPVTLQTNNAQVQQPNSSFVWQYRLIVRTSELLTLRGSILEDVIPNIKPTANIKTFSAKEVFEYVTPEIHLACLRLGISGTGAEEQLLRLDEQCLTRHYKVGIMYCRKGQSTEEDMYNNQEAGPAFVEFLQSLGQTVRLKGFNKYKAGLDNKTDSTGLHSVYTVHQDCEIMFHVSTMLPYTPNNRQQLLRKRHIGNDIVTIVFQEPGAQAFTPKNIRSQFQHVFVVVRAVNPCSENTHYCIAVSRSKEVPMFGPPLIEGALYPKSKYFTELLLSKVINAENAAHLSPKFSTMATRTRQEYLKDLAINYITATPLDTGQKFSIFSSLLMKSTNGSNPPVVSRPNEQSRVDSSREYHVGGALCWPVSVQDEGAGGTTVECFFGISADSVVLIEEVTRQIVFVAPIKSLLAWATSSGGWVRLFYHCGECVRLQAAGADDGEASAMVRRLTALGVRAARRLAVARGASGQLGFHVRRDGLVTGVAAGGGAYRAGLRRSHRLLEICRAAVASLPHERMVDLLKTAAPVALAITPEPSPTLCQCEDDDGSVAMTTSPPPSQTSSPRRVARPQPAQPTNTTNSLQQELMRLIEPETAPGIVTMARPAQVVPPAPTSSLNPSSAANLPLPDARALDWPALVDTATRAMLQFNDEQQYASLDNSTDSSILNHAHDVSSDASTETWTEPPADTCGCGLAPRVYALEQEVSRLRRHNARLRDESARAVRQLRRFTQWFVHTVDRPP